MKRSPMRRKRTPDIPPKVRAEVARRSSGFCEAWIEGVCPAHYHRAAHLHHKRTRSQGGKHTPENLLAVCLPAHEHIHAHPSDAYDAGWLIRSAS